MITPHVVPSTADSTHAFTVSLELLEGYAFRVQFDHDDVEPLHTDELPPLGAGSGPSPSRLLAASISNCLAASLVHCLRRSRVSVRGLTATATVAVGRNDRGRLRIQRVDVVLSPAVDAAHVAQLERCSQVFQEYCTVTASLREGFEIGVDVAPAPGTGA
jgi:uncharacterized OsmC-like protein